MQQAEAIIDQNEAIEPETRVAHQRLLLITLVVFALVSIGSLGCVSFGVSEIVNHDRALMNDGLGEIMTILGICFTLPCLFCVVLFAAFTLASPCLSVFFSHTTVVLIGCTLLFFVAQAVFYDILLYSCIGLPALVAVAADICTLGAYAYLRFRSFCFPTALFAAVLVGKMSVFWGFGHKLDARGEAVKNGVHAVLFLTIAVVQLPLYAAPPDKIFPLERRLATENTIVGNFNHNSSLVFLHLLNSLDIIAMYGALVIPGVENTCSGPIPGPFQALILVLVCVAFVGNNVSVIYLFYGRDGVQRAELTFLPKRMRDASHQWGSEDVGGGHGRRILQYLLLLLVVCDVPFLLLRVQLWLRGYRALNIFSIKNMKAIVDAAMVLLHVDHSSGPAECSRRLLSDAG